MRNALLSESPDAAIEEQRQQCYGVLSLVSVSQDARFAYYTLPPKDEADERTWEERRVPLTGAELDDWVSYAETVV